MTIDVPDATTTDRTICDELVERWPTDIVQASKAVSIRTRRRRTLNLYGTTAAVVGVLVAIGFVMVGQQVSVGGVTVLFVALALATTAVVMGLLGNRSQDDTTAIEDGLATRRPHRTCPRCGEDPFIDAGCCHRFPRGWSEIDLHGFWHELAGIQRDHGDTDRAYQRPRSPVGSSVRRPRGSSLAMSTLRRQRPVAKIALALLYLAGIWGTVTASTLDDVTRGIVLILLALGVVSVLAGLRIQAPAGTETHARCAGCRYILRPPYLDRCPECGAELESWTDVTFDPDEPVFQDLDSRVTKSRRWLLGRLTWSRDRN